MSQPSIYAAESDRLHLEPLNIKKHLEDFHELWNDEETVRWTIKTPKVTIEETASWFPSILPTKEIPDIDKFAILLKPEFMPETNIDNSTDESREEKLKCVGIIGTNRWSDQGMEMGYVINREYWGRGFATEAVRCFLGWFWATDERKNIDSLVAKVYPGNEKSIGVLRKCGAREGETLKGVERNGEKEDMICSYFDRPIEGV